MALHGPVKFRGSLEGSGCVKVHAEGGFMLQIAVPETDKPAIIKLLDGRGQVLDFEVDIAKNQSWPKPDTQDPRQTKLPGTSKED